MTTSDASVSRVERITIDDKRRLKIMWEKLIRKGLDELQLSENFTWDKIS